MSILIKASFGMDIPFVDESDCALCSVGFNLPCKDTSLCITYCDDSGPSEVLKSNSSASLMFEGATEDSHHDIRYTAQFFRL